ncbi:Tat binding protein 1-interacting protein-domain-containing protein [Cokeromyces recurvatus]|uniref:Tat binding protein 1-interacting protein-domain-containing protein n=1 Tax=Cokeromyces recurvatus TaxID=90255 RepID=UPI002220BACF|nr:Tat binding protein 1-interacting protein-domain-containing protein [Cokeromyces recurvatus]KAI7901116.1 Tat binding protein 1-interacting protein-domain-containing protein [Cokeromyces recurvatus]
MVKKKGNGINKEEADIFNNLHSKYSKGVITKVLDKLIEDDLVLSKTYGKSIIYSIKQDIENIPGQEEQELIDKSINEFTQKYEDLSMENKRLDQTLSDIKSTPTTSEARLLIEKLQKENELLKEKLYKLKNGTVLISPEKRKRTNDEYESNRNLWKKRRAMFRDIFSAVTEHFPGKPNELKEELGIEDDPIPLEKDPLEIAQHQK